MCSKNEQIKSLSIPGKQGQTYLDGYSAVLFEACETFGISRFPTISFPNFKMEIKIVQWLGLNAKAKTQAL